MRVSCVIPCYNSEEYVKATVESVINQTFQPSEVLLINDASTDSTIDILQKLKTQHSNLVRVVNFEKNRGASFARNYGVAISKTDYILFMDSDDLAEPELIEKSFERLHILNSAGKNRYIMCYSAYVQIDDKDNLISEVVRGMQVEPEEILGYEFVRNNISTSGVLVNRDYFVLTGGFNEKIIYAEDWDLWLKLARFGGFAYVDEPLTRIRRHKTSLSSKINSMLDGEKAILKQYDLRYIKEAVLKRKLDKEINVVDYVTILFKLDYWDEGYKELDNLIRDGCGYYNIYFNMGLYYLKHNNFAQAISFFKKTIAAKPEHGAALNNLGALYLLNGDKDLAKRHLELALTFFPSYMDAECNYQLLPHKSSVVLDELKFTWRELRKVLTVYND